MLRRDGWMVGRNLVWRLYREEGLALRHDRPVRGLGHQGRHRHRLLSASAPEPADCDVHVVLNNAAHKTRIVQNWLIKREHFHLHFPLDQRLPRQSAHDLWRLSANS